MVLLATFHFGKFPLFRLRSVLNITGHAKLGMVSGEDIWYASPLDLAKMQGSIIA